jgi:hypothetical protein
MRRQRWIYRKAKQENMSFFRKALESVSGHN